MRLCVVVVLALPVLVNAQPPTGRLNGRLLNVEGQPLTSGEIRAEALYGPEAGTFAGQRKLAAPVLAEGTWSLLGVLRGIWLLEGTADGYMPSVVVLPIRMRTASSPNAGGMMFDWQLPLKLRPLPAGEAGSRLVTAMGAAREGRVDDMRKAIGGISADAATFDYLVGAANIALIAHDWDVSRALYARAASMHGSFDVTLGLASLSLANRDFNDASKRFGSAQKESSSKDEQRFIAAALADLRTVNGLPAGDVLTHKH